MVKEAEANKEADEKRKEEADVRNNADSLVFATEKAITDLGDKVDQKDKEEAEAKIKDLKDALAGTDTEDIKKKTDALNEIAMKLATKAYEEAAKENQNNNAENNTSSNTKNDDVEEANYEEK
jgi:molecular chaperone DnaK